jgi:hypothetical protein
MTCGCQPAWRSKTAVLGAVVVAAVVAAGAVRSAEPAPLSFDGATLGMAISDWKSLPPPPGVGPDAGPMCAPLTQVTNPSGHALAAALRPTDAQACGYDARFGHDVLPRSIQLDQRYRATGVRYLFVGGRLSEIDFSASIDAYNDVMAMLTQEYGPPTLTTRDSSRTSLGRFPSLRQTWRTPAGVVTLVDPAADPVQITVRFAGPGPRV